jgi:hypothetical protein
MSFEPFQLTVQRKGCHVGHESFAREEEPKITAKDYFLSCGYGLEFYTDSEIEQMFKELDTIASLWPKDASMKLIDLHSKWRDRYYKYWYKRWFWKFRTRQ